MGRDSTVHIRLIHFYSSFHRTTRLRSTSYGRLSIQHCIDIEKNNCSDETLSSSNLAVVCLVQSFFFYIVDLLTCHCR